ncbi:MAG TPA: hypothetical protein VKD90_18490 [Gemmataceae bacterium]|nr:hypothetical protein [Gemmataceae bacterium]
MNPRAVCLLILVVAAGPAAAETKTFFEAQCQYKKAGPEWEWLDPKTAPPGPGKAIAFLRRPDGRTLTVRYWPRDMRPDAQSFQSIADEVLSSGDFKKSDSRRRSFKGTSCYEIDVQSRRSNEAARVRILFANDNAYQLTITDAPDRLGDTDDTDPTFKGFEFRPPEEREEEVADAEEGRPRSEQTRVVWSIALIPVVGFIIWMYRLRMAARTGKPGLW